MTKIFEALQKGQGEISEMLPQVLEEQDAVLREPILPEVTTEAEVRAVLGDSGPIQQLLSVKTSNGISQRSVRQVPIRIPASTPLLPFDNTNFSAAEQYRMIRTKLIQHPRQPRLILISSAVPGDGKSVTAVNIAGALALKTEANVLLVDTDFRRSTIHIQLGLPASPGLTEVLTGIVSLEEALVQTAQLPNLYVIPAGARCANPSELLDSSVWSALCSELRSRFRYVIADSPPVASVADYELLQAAYDGVILVVRPDHTKRQLSLRALQTIPRDKLLGVVMNCVPNWFLARYQSYTLYDYGEEPRK